ncbi:hypothetical protein ACMHYO_07605 [Allopusillimonas ginsengisoli]|uniref:hypothetical protein n=1 Tax=Allopusillimonas ginsengisoli TaxID=453575 RepID=UPI0039C31453
METYRRFIDKLNKGIEGEIVEYRVEPGERCVIYPSTARQAIFIEREVSEQAKSEAILLLQAQIIREGLGDKKSLSPTLPSVLLVVKYVE